MYRLLTLEAPTRLPHGFDGIIDPVCVLPEDGFVACRPAERVTNDGRYPIDAPSFMRKRDRGLVVIDQHGHVVRVLDQSYVPQKPSSSGALPLLRDGRVLLMHGADVLNDIGVALPLAEDQRLRTDPNAVYDAVLAATDDGETLVVGGLNGPYFRVTRSSGRIEQLQGLADAWRTEIGAILPDGTVIGSSGRWPDLLAPKKEFHPVVWWPESADPELLWGPAREGIGFQISFVKAGSRIAVGFCIDPWFRLPGDDLTSPWAPAILPLDGGLIRTLQLPSSDGQVAPGERSMVVPTCAPDHCRILYGIASTAAGEVGFLWTGPQPTALLSVVADRPSDLRTVVPYCCSGDGAMIGVNINRGPDNETSAALLLCE